MNPTGARRASDDHVAVVVIIELLCLLGGRLGSVLAMQNATNSRYELSRFFLPVAMRCSVTSSALVAVASRHLALGDVILVVANVSGLTSVRGA